MPKKFQEHDISPYFKNDRGTQIYQIWANREDLIYSETADPKPVDGYGQKITTDYLINVSGQEFRVYATCFGNSASLWFNSSKRKIIIS